MRPFYLTFPSPSKIHNPFNPALCIYILSNPASQHSTFIPLKLQHILLILIIPVVPFTHHNRGRDGQMAGVSHSPPSHTLLHLTLSFIFSFTPTMVPLLLASILHSLPRFLSPSTRSSHTNQAPFPGISCSISLQ